MKARPDLLAASRQVKANEAAIRLSDANGKTDPQFGMEYEHSGTGNTFGGNLQIPLRIFDRNQGERERTRREAESSRQVLQQAVNQVVSDVDQAYFAYQAAVAQNARYQTKYLSEAAHVRDNLEFSYRNGDATLLDYLSALQDYRQTNLAALNAQAQAQTALHQLSYATATEVNP
jgi:cobalt-zinc-cadmium efflux system outer membrane protein